MLAVHGVNKCYKKGGWLSRDRQQVLHDVEFQCKRGECLGIIGESGSGKSTLGRLLLGLEKPDRGRITFEGRSVLHRKVRKGALSAVFQDYTSSINPFYTVEEAIQESLKNASSDKLAAYRRMDELLEMVGLDVSYRVKYPHELSGGEAQRVCIARAIASEPACIVLDEALSSLDMPVQAGVLQLLKDIRRKHGMSYIFITHDIEAAAFICDRIMIVRHGRIVEIVEAERLKDVESDYAKELLQKMMAL
ncbi:ABC transporter ATP-binding protein [Paenibacillus sp. J5C_2022]|uniref:ABC transporter ATP-binding protein n=1 Tax=Paenibacillus sp. J5C2022 TaxID=2977129 RepID=UPI0021CE049A|nr:ABC transporter ATP-binding protein [Paenibacillus sp. J5C2022]MCU6711760.1 ABC transporter ATP-binding protein [Paenibacillus sp. J5C2022]